MMFDVLGPVLDAVLLAGAGDGKLAAGNGASSDSAAALRWLNKVKNTGITCLVPLIMPPTIRVLSTIIPAYSTMVWPLLDSLRRFWGVFGNDKAGLRIRAKDPVLVGDGPPGRDSQGTRPLWPFWHFGLSATSFDRINSVMGSLGFSKT